MMVVDQEHRRRRLASKDRAREGALVWTIRDLEQKRRLQDVALGRVRRAILRGDDGRSLRDAPLEVRNAHRAEANVLRSGNPIPGGGGAQCDGLPANAACQCAVNITEDGVRAGVRERYALLDGLRSISRPRTRGCRRTRVSTTVQVFCDRDSVSFSGVATCGSVHGCPVCAAKIYAARAAELEGMIDQWIGYREDRKGPIGAVAGMLTLTIRHGAGDSLARVAKGLAEAWRHVFCGRAGQRLRAELRLEHFARAAEYTHGEHGWHPHLHCITLHEGAVPKEALRMLLTRWKDAVANELGAAYVPDDEHGMTWKEFSPEEEKGRYLAKAGLELSGIYTKEGRHGNRTYWQVGKDAANGDGRSIGLWKEAQEALFGSKQLTFSRGTRERFCLPDLTDDELAADEQPLAPAEERFRIEIPALAWDSARSRDPRFVSRLVAAVLASERGSDWVHVLGIVTRRFGQSNGCGRVLHN